MLSGDDSIYTQIERSAMKDKIEILVVDDDATHRLMLRAVLTDEGYKVTEAQDGAEAVEKIKQTFFDIILMDVRMKFLNVQ